MDYYGNMPLPLGARGGLPLGGQDIYNAQQYGGPTPEAVATYQRMQAEQAAQAQAQAQAATQAQVASQAASQVAARQEGAAGELVDWPTYLKSHTADDPATIYEDYVNVAGPSQWVAAGLPPDQVKATQDLFRQRVPKPASVRQPVDAGIFGNMAAAAGQELRTGKRTLQAGATSDPLKLAGLVAEQAADLPTAPQARYQREGGFKVLEPVQSAKNILNNPQAALLSLEQTLIGFVPFIASGATGGAVGSLAGPLGSLAGSAAGMGAYAAESSRGAVLLEHIARGVQEAGIDIKDAPKVQQWIETNGPKLFGDAWKSGATQGLITLATAGVTGAWGQKIAQSAAEAGRVGAAEAAAKAAGVEATRQGTQTAAQRISSLKRQQAGKIGTEIGGFTGASAAGAVAAGDTPDANEALSMGLSMLLPSLFHARGQIKSARDVGVQRRVEPEKPASSAEALGDEATFPPGEAQLPPKPPPPGEPPPPAPPPVTHPDYLAESEALRTMQEGRMGDEVSVREELGLPAKTKAGGLKQTALDKEVKAIVNANSTEAKADAYQALAEAADKKGKADVVERAQAKADELRSLIPPTEDEVVDHATALHLARDLVQETINEQITQAAEEVKAASAARQAASVAPTVPTAEGAVGAIPPAATAAATPPAGRRTTPRKRAAGLKSDTTVQQAVGGEAQVRPGVVGGPRVDQEVVKQTVEPVPERGQPAGIAGGGGAAVAAGPKRARGIKQGAKPADVTIAVKDLTLLEQQALMKRLVAAGIDVKQAFGRSGVLEFNTPEAKAAAEKFMAEEKAMTDKVAAALTGMKEEAPKSLKAEAVKARKENRAADLRYMEKEMGYDKADAKNMYDDAVEAGTLRDLQKEIDDHKKQAEADKGLREAVPLAKDVVEGAVKAEDLGRIEKGAVDYPAEERPFSVPGVRLQPAFIERIRQGAVDSKQALDYLSTKGDSKLTRTLAAQLREVLGDASIPLRVEDFIPSKEDPKIPAWGQYEYGRNLITGEYYHDRIGFMHEGMDEHTLLHELTHAATVQAFRFPKTEMQRLAGKRMQNIYQQALKALHKTGEAKPRGLANELEFMAEAFSNPEFQKELAKHMYRDPLHGTNLRIPTLWQAFKDTVGRLLTGNKEPSEQMSLLHAAIAHSADLFDTADTLYGKKTSAIDYPHPGYPDKAKFPYGEPGSPERKAFLREENRLLVAELGRRMDAIKEKIAAGKEINWSRDWEADTRVRSLAEAQRELADLKGRYPDVETKAIDYPAEIKADKKKENERVAAFVATPHDAMLGLNPDSGERTHIAYRNDDGTYNLYEASPENLKGDPDTKRVNLPHDEVLRILKEDGSVSMQRTGTDFKDEPKNTRTEINGWEDGARKFAAFKQPDGTWNVYTGDNLTESKPPPTKVKDYDAVMAEYRKGNYLRTQAQDVARTRDQTPRDLAQYEGPSRQHLNWWNWRAPLQYIAAQAEQQFGKLPEYLRPDIPATLKNSWINRDVRTMERDEWNPLREDILSLNRAFSRTGDQFEQDIAALASAERSATKLKTEGYEDLPELRQKITKNLDEARAHLRTLDPAYLARLEQVARTAKHFADATIDKQVAMGMMPAEKGASIKQAYKFYVPMQEGKYTSSGVRATGQTAKSDRPMQRLVDQRIAVIVRGYENMEKRAVYELASKYNWQTKDGKKMFDIAPILKYGFDKDGMINSVLDPLVMNNKAIMVMIDGKPYRMGINDPDFLNALKDVTAPKHAAMMTAMRAGARFNAIYGGLKTAASPVFAVKNLIRDAATALAQNDPRVSTTQLATSLVNPKIWMSALHDAFEVGHNKPGGKQGVFADFAAKVRDAGGLIDRRTAYGMDATVDTVNANIDPRWMKTLPKAIQKQFSIEHGLFLKPLTVWTKTLENVTRMAVFDAAKKSDPSMSDHEAALLAKNTTVNFEPKGAYAGLVNPLYVFANAKLQGTRTYAEKLGLTGIRGGNMLQRLERGNRRTQAVSGLALLIGMLTAKYGYDNSEKDEDGRSAYGKLSDYQKDDYLTVKSGGLSIPLPPEFGAFHILGQSLVDAQMNDRWADPDMRRQKAATRFATGMMQTFAPLGTSMSDPVSDKPGGTMEYVKRMLLPTPLTIPTDIASNTTTFGSPIVTGVTPGTPLYATNAKDYPNSAAVTKKLHDILGVNVAPQTIKYVTDQIVKPQVDIYKAIFGEPEIDALGRPKPSVVERTFFQKASPFADKEDLQEIKDRIINNTYDPLKKGKPPELKMFDDADKRIKAAQKGWKNMTPEQRQKADARITTIRANTLKKYQRTIEQAEGVQP